MGNENCKSIEDILKFMRNQNCKSIEDILNSLSKIEDLILNMKINEENSLLFEEFNKLRAKIISNIQKANAKKTKELEYY